MVSRRSAFRPANYAQTISTFTGTAGANWGGGVGSTLTSVEVSLLDLNTTNYWGGTSFNLFNTPTWQTATGTTSWTYFSNQFASVFANAANHGHIFNVWARGHTSDGGTGVTGSSWTFMLDNQPPGPGHEGTLDVTSPPSNTRVNIVNSIGGDVEDPTSGVLAGTVTLRIIDTGYIGGGPTLYWNGSGFTSNATNFVQLNSVQQPANLPPNNNVGHQLELYRHHQQQLYGRAYLSASGPSGRRRRKPERLAAANHLRLYLCDVSADNDLGLSHPGFNNQYNEYLYDRAFKHHLRNLL